MRHLSIAAILICVPSLAFAGAKEDGQAVFEKFIAGFNSANADNLAKLFAPDALFWGTRSSELITTNDGVRQYFVNAFHALPGAKASLIGAPSVAVLSDDAVVVSGLWQVAAEIEGKSTIIPLRNSVAVVKRGDQWLIGSFHNSPRP